jgi:lysophospholipase L1-like esterase
MNTSLRAAAVAFLFVISMCAQGPLPLRVRDLGGSAAPSGACESGARYTQTGNPPVIWVCGSGLTWAQTINGPGAGLGMANPSQPPLLRFYAKLGANAGTSTMCVGDSITAGTGATTNSSGWCGQVASWLAQRYGQGGMFTFSYGSDTGSFAYSGTWTGETAVGPNRGGVFTVRSASSSATATYSPGMGYDTIDLYYATFSDSAAFAVSVDGTPQGTFGGTPTGTYTFARQSFTVSRTATHTLVVTAPASGKVYLLGASTRVAASGINHINAGFGGFRSDDFASAAENDWVSLIPNLGLTIISLGHNDTGTPAETVANLAQIAAKASAAGSSVLILIENNTVGAPARARDLAIKQFATANGYGWVSIADRWGVMPDNSLGLMLDNDHPSQAGHNDIAAALWAYLAIPNPTATVQYANFTNLLNANRNSFNFGFRGVSQAFYDFTAPNESQPSIRLVTPGSQGGLRVLGNGVPDFFSGSTVLWLSNSGKQGAVWISSEKTGFNVASPPAEVVDVNGNIRLSGQILSNGLPFASLGALSNGAMVYCSNCTKATPCASGGTGAFAKRLNGAWDCN